MEVAEALNLHNPFLQPAFKSAVLLYFLVSLPICSCQTTHVRKIGALHCETPPDACLLWGKKRWEKRKKERFCKPFGSLRVTLCLAIMNKGCGPLLVPLPRGLHF